MGSQSELDGSGRRGIEKVRCLNKWLRYVVAPTYIQCRFGMSSSSQNSDCSDSRQHPDLWQHRSSVANGEYGPHADDRAHHLAGQQAIARADKTEAEYDPGHRAKVAGLRWREAVPREVGDPDVLAGVVRRGPGAWKGQANERGSGEDAERSKCIGRIGGELVARHRDRMIRVSIGSGTQRGRLEEALQGRGFHLNIGWPYESVARRARLHSVHTFLEIRDL